MKQQQRFEVPIVIQNLSPAETLHQMFDNLQRMEDIVDDIFNRLTHRIKQENDKITNICKRIAQAQSKVILISQNQNKSTKVHSAPKYPAPKTLPDFTGVNLWESNNCLRERGEPMDLKLSLMEQKKVIEQVDATELFQSLMNRSRYDVDPICDVLKEGLGRLPEGIEDVSSILLFNTAENPYKKYVSLDNLLGVGGIDREKRKDKLTDAPETIISGDQLPQFSGLEFGFKPVMREVPALDFQSILPNLPGVVDDINWSLGDGQIDPNQLSIAPSTSQIIELPTVEFYQTSMTDARTKNLTAPGQESTVNVLDDTNLPGIPPPPPACAFAQNASSNLPVPPGPPPAAPEIYVPNKVNNSSGGGRAELMDSIRNAKGALSKGRTKKQHRRDPLARIEIDTPDKSIMSALTQNLLRRRAAMEAPKDVRSGDTTDEWESD